MDSKKSLINALEHGDIAGNEAKIAECLLVCDKDELDMFKKYAYFPEVIAAVWRNKEVIAHLDKLTTLSVSQYFEILKHVNFTLSESSRIVNAIIEREDITDAYVVNNMVHAEYKAFITGSEEVWKAVFGRD